jgi:hypothetical protein
MLDTTLPVPPEEIASDAVDFRIRDQEKTFFQLGPL